MNDLTNRVAARRRAQQKERAAEQARADARATAKLRLAIEKYLGWHVTCDSPRYRLPEYPYICLMAGEQQGLLSSRSVLMAHDTSRLYVLDARQIKNQDDLVQFIADVEAERGRHAEFYRNLADIKEHGYAGLMELEGGE